MKPTQKIELRPKVEHSDQQLWTYYQGYLINKHTAYGNIYSQCHVFSILIILLYSVGL
jgi:hypothetical protein